MEPPPAAQTPQKAGWLTGLIVVLLPLLLLVLVVPPLSRRPHLLQAVPGEQRVPQMEYANSGDGTRIARGAQDVVRPLVRRFEYGSWIVACRQ